jgi:hypothetical protein
MESQDAVTGVYLQPLLALTTDHCCHSLAGYFLAVERVVHS